jgi:DNA polymerase
VPEPTAHTLETELRAMTAWWREAGVDCDFADTPTNWLAEPEDDTAEEARPANAPAPAPVEAPIELVAGGPANWPTTLEAFDAWWLAEPSLAIGARARVAPRGPADAPLMVLVCEPEAEDGAALLSGPQGALLANILAAFGLAPDEARIAALLPSCVPHPDWAALDRVGWGALTRHHLALAAPRRLLVLGPGALPLLGHDPAQDSADFRQVAHEGGVVPALCAPDLDTLLHRPRAKARLWHRWLEWTDG